MVTQVQILGKANCISQSTNALKKAINLIIVTLWVNSRADWVLSPWLNNQCRRWKTKFKPIELCLKIDLMSHLAHAEELVNIYIYVCVCVCVCVCVWMTICICSPNPVGLSSLTNEVITLPLVYMQGPSYMNWSLGSR